MCLGIINAKTILFIILSRYASVFCHLFGTRIPIPSKSHSHSTSPHCSQKLHPQPAIYPPPLSWYHYLHSGNFRVNNFDKLLYTSFTVNFNSILKAARIVLGHYSPIQASKTSMVSPPKQAWIFKFQLQPSNWAHSKAQSKWRHRPAGSGL